MIFAHAADWIANIAFAAPAIAIVIAVAVAKVRERRAAREQGLASPPRPASTDFHQTTARPDDQEPS